MASPSWYFFAFRFDEGQRPMAFDVFFTPFQLILTPVSNSPQVLCEQTVKDSTGERRVSGWGCAGKEWAMETSKFVPKGRKWARECAKTRPREGHQNRKINEEILRRRWAADVVRQIRKG